MFTRCETDTESYVYYWIVQNSFQGSFSDNISLRRYYIAASEIQVFSISTYSFQAKKFLRNVDKDLARIKERLDVEDDDEDDEEETICDLTINNNVENNSKISFIDSIRDSKSRTACCLFIVIISVVVIFILIFAHEEFGVIEQHHHHHQQHDRHHENHASSSRNWGERCDTKDRIICQLFIPDRFEKKSQKKNMNVSIIPF